MQVATALIGFELFQKMATVGVEKLNTQISSSMTREEILSKAVEQIAFRGNAYAIIQGRNKESATQMQLKREETNMFEGKALVDDSDMPLNMQIEAMSFASQALDLYDVFDCISIAGYIKKEFDSKYGNGWQCVRDSSSLSSKWLHLQPLLKTQRHGFNFMVLLQSWYRQQLKKNEG
ncbi:hypothetical protein GOBAR_DD00439 [Gossypium barbadense]|nr:hypothetical protein GOBAR_DD00439 [Gossypium barbadense]